MTLRHTSAPGDMGTRKNVHTKGGTLQREISSYAVELQIITEKDYYLPDEALNGKIYFTVREPLNINKLIAVVEGYNHVAWEEGKARSIYAEDAKLFEERILVRSFTKPIPVGSYVFSFSYVVPEFLPSSFSVDGAKSLKWEDIALREASVDYSIKAVIERNDVPIAKEAIQDFLIHSRPEKTKTETRQDITEQIKTFGCFPRGYVTVSLSLDKTFYSADDTLGLKVEVTNMTPLVCRNIIAVLFRKLKVLAQRSQRNIRTKEYMIAFEDVPSGEKAIFKRDIDLSQTDILPTTNSRNIKCNYVFAVRCDVPFATSIDATLPVTMVIEPNKDHVKKFPPEQLYKPWKS